ncbi:hypothetical protein [Meridianimarinicoccus sp. MJW13]|uniref:hypothetical protein n=1 Tax=Meridianimarinicoccus sp. MJW13 TaxID=2720031 RepID=UPI0018690179|nr:hypothetical protein [Fluviibacterium sp. MJW13]
MQSVDTTPARPAPFPSALWAICLLLPTLILTIALLQSAISVEYLFMDPHGAAKAAVRNADAPDETHIRYALGLISLLGSSVWGFSVSALLLAGLLRHRAGDRQAAGVLIFGAGLTLLLVADDLFRLHENLPDLLPINETPLMAAYAGLGIAYCALAVLRLRERVSLWPLITALGFFALSVVADHFLYGVHTSWMILLEDAPKLYGIFVWSGFHFWLALRACE